MKIPQSVLVVVYTPALEVLLIERTDQPGFWQSVTGSKDFLDEPLERTAQREVLEETGFDMAQLPDAALHDWCLSNRYEIYPVWQKRYGPGVTHNTEHVFGLQLPDAFAPRLNPREHLAWQWLPYQEAAERCFSPSNAEAVLLLPRFAAKQRKAGCRA